MADAYSQAYLDEDRRPQLLSVAILFSALTTVAVILRFISRRIGKVGWRLDDFLIVLGWAFLIALVEVTIGDVKYSGVGLHQARVVATDPHMMVNWAKYLLAIALIYVVAVTLPKVAVLILYLDLFSIHRPTRIICYVTGFIMVGNMVANICAGFSICRPIDTLWNGGDIAHHCFNINAWFRYSRVVNIFSDVVMLILPLPHVFFLQLNRRLKIGLTITFLSGSLGLIASILALSQSTTTNAVADNTWSAASLITWSLTEAGMYLVTACLGTYLPLVRYLWHRLKRAQQKETSSLENNAPLNSSKRTSLAYCDTAQSKINYPEHDVESTNSGIELENHAFGSEGGTRGKIMVEQQIVVRRGEHLP